MGRIECPVSWAIIDQRAVPALRDLIDDAISQHAATVDASEEIEVWLHLTHEEDSTVT